MIAEWLKKWWFSIAMWLFALIILIYGIVMLCLGEIELFYQGGILASYSIMTLIVLLVGLANMPGKEKKENKKDTIKKFNEVEKNILKSLDPSYKYITRNRDGDLWIYDDCPEKPEGADTWCVSSSKVYCLPFIAYNHLFQSIKWEDEKPYKFR